MFDISGKLYIVGIGPGSKDFLTYKAVDIVGSVDVVIGSQRAVDLFDKMNKTIVFNVKNLTETLEESVDLVLEGSTVAVLSTGDPGFSGVLAPIKRISNEKGLDLDSIIVVPGISSLQLAAARNHINWDSANIMTFHGRENISDILDVINNGNKTIALPSRKVKDMAQFLLDNGVDGDRSVIVCERLSYDDERVVHSCLKDIAKSEFTYMCILII